MTRLLDDIGNFCLWVSSAMIVIWVIQYSLLAKWWRNFIGISIVGLALCLLAIYIPSLMALADPVDYANFATTRWYLWLTVGIVIATMAFLGTRIITWEVIRRRRDHGRRVLLPAELMRRITELEAENACLQRRLGEGS